MSTYNKHAKRSHKTYKGDTTAARIFAVKNKTVKQKKRKSLSRSWGTELSKKFRALIKQEELYHEQDS